MYYKDWKFSNEQQIMKIEHDLENVNINIITCMCNNFSKQ